MSLFHSLLRGLKDVKNIFYPRTCLNCNALLQAQEYGICHRCASQLVFTHYDFDSQNPVFDRLSAVVPIHKASSLFLYDKAGVIKHLIHQLKYNNQAFVGKLLAQYAINYYNKNSFVNAFDYIIPVPLHPKKQQERGYNQLVEFGKNLGNYYSIPYTEKILLRSVYTGSQTKKSAQERRENVAHAFTVHKAEIYAGKRFLLVDDVLTTGATIEACVETLMGHIPDVQVSVLTMAVVM